MTRINMIQRKRYQLLIAFSFLVVFSTVLMEYYHKQSLLKCITESVLRALPSSGKINNLVTKMNRSNQSTMVTEKKIVHLKTILIWNSPERVEAGSEFGTGHQPFIDHGCLVSNCYIQRNDSSEFWSRATANNSEGLKSFDAVVIGSFRIPYAPNYERPARQRVIWLTQEAPGGKEGFGDIDQYPTMFDRVFNWTMTFQRESDIYLPYGKIHPIQNRTQNFTRLREERRATLANKTGIVSWMVSHCETGSRREDYVRELQKYIQVDVYGECGNLSCPRGNHWISYPECYEMINRKYKFYLSFENSMCRDYITEKFFSIFEQPMIVPVVFGGADYRSIVPQHSYINALDFSPAKLAEYLRLLDGDDELYLDYLEWKSHYWVEAGMEKMNRQAFCDLCAKLNRVDEPTKIYDSLMPQWSAKIQCKPGWSPEPLNVSITKDPQ